jgi:hypothetical protein
MRIGCPLPGQCSITAPRVPGQPGGRGDVGPQPLERGQPDAGAQHEHAGVPVVAAVVDVAARGRRVGLLDECGDFMHAGAGRAAGADVAVAGLGPVGAHAEDHDVAGGGLAHRTAQRARERGVVGDGLVGRGDNEHRVGAGVERVQRGQRQRRRGIAPARLEQHRSRVEPALAQLVEHEEAVLFVADDQRRSDRDALAGQRGEPARGLLEQALVAGQHEKLFGVAGARERPQPGARATGHHDGLHGNGAGVHGWAPVRWVAGAGEA